MTRRRGTSSRLRIVMALTGVGLAVPAGFIVRRLLLDGWDRVGGALAGVMLFVALDLLIAAGRGARPLVAHPHFNIQHLP